MKLIKYDNFWNDPFADFDSTMRQILGDRFNLPALFADDFGEDFARSFRIDSFVNDECYQVFAELPGIPKKDIEIKLENAVLTISGEHKTGKGDNASSIKFNRSITVGEGIDPDKVEASLENGLLTVTLPKVKELKPHTIKVS